MKTKILNLLSEYQKYLDKKINTTTNTELKQVLENLKSNLNQKEEQLNKFMLTAGDQNYEQVFINLESEFLFLQISLNTKETANG